MMLPRYVMVNLTTEKIENYPIDRHTAELFIGSKGLAASILYNLMVPGTNPLSPQNVLIINTSPVTGTGAPCTSRFNASTKSPLTGGIGSSNCGGPFGIMLRKAGFDGIIILGKAAKASMIEVADGEVFIKDASHLWGMDTEETQHKIGFPYSSLVIGPAGENLIRYACAVSGERVLGRCGIGAVMGSKNLKAVTAVGTQPIKVHNREELTKYIEKWVKILKDRQATGFELPRYGSAGFVNTVNENHIMPTHNFKRTKYINSVLLSGETLADTFLTGNSGCLSCPIRCERRVRVGDKEVKGPEFETIGLFGSNIENSSLEKIIEWNYLADKLGMDTISLAGTISFAMELQENGIVDFGLRFGETSNMSETIVKIAHREGVWGQLAEGSKWLSEKYGGKEYAIHSKGLELASYDPRRSTGLGLGYATANRGGCHLNGGYLVYMEVTGPVTMDGVINKGKPEMTMFFQNAMEAISTTGFCLFTAMGLLPNVCFRIRGTRSARLVGKSLVASRRLVAQLATTPGLMRFNSRFLFPHSQIIKLVTGLDMTTGKFLEVGERSFNIERLFNLREGFTEKDDTLPTRLTSEPSDPKRQDTIVNLNELLPKYYRLRGWDAQGIPTLSTRKRLSI